MLFRSIEYKVDGMEYTFVRKIANPVKQKLGKEIVLKYNPVNPMDAIEKYDYSGLLTIIISLAFLVIGIYFFR